jgi:O-antigen ligase
MLALMVRVSAETARRALTLTYGLSLAAIILVLVNTLVLNLDQTYWPGRGRLGTEALNPISLGHLATTVIVLSTHTLTSNHNVSARIVIVSFITILIGLVTVVLAASRGPLLALVVAELVLVLSVFMRRQKTRLNILAALLIFTVTVMAAVYYLFISDSEIAAHFSYRGEDTVSMRFEMFSAAWKNFTEAPLFGSALELMEYGVYPHNVVIESFMATGILGGTAFSILLLSSFLYALRLVNSYDSYSWVGLLFIQYVIGSLVSGSLYSSTTMWALMGAVIGVSGFSRGLRSLHSAPKLAEDR